MPGGLQRRLRDFHYELKSLTLQMLVGGLFDRAFRRLRGSFETPRARHFYGATS
jgi:ribosome-associated toxin RatA of RatAB toxin-antitoxin module